MFISLALFSGLVVVNVVGDMVLMGSKMIRSGVENEAEMWKRIVIDAGLMIDAKSAAMNAVTETAHRYVELSGREIPLHPHGSSLSEAE